MTEPDPIAALAAQLEELGQVAGHRGQGPRPGASRSALEVPLGEGNVDWLRLAGVLEEIEYRGWLVVEREGGAHARADVVAGVAFLRQIMR